MRDFFVSNGGTIIISLFLAACVIVIVRNMLKQRKSGKSAICGDDCKTCGHCCNLPQAGQEKK